MIFAKGTVHAMIISGASVTTSSCPSTRRVDEMRRSILGCSFDREHAQLPQPQTMFSLPSEAATPAETCQKSLDASLRVYHERRHPTTGRRPVLGEDIDTPGVPSSHWRDPYILSGSVLPRAKCREIKVSSVKPHCILYDETGAVAPRDVSGEYKHCPLHGTDCRPCGQGYADYTPKEVRGWRWGVR